VSAPPEALAALRVQRARQDERRRLLGRLWKGETVPGFIFDNGEGVRLSANTARQRLEKAITSAGVPRVSFHALRHSGATALARGGMPMYLLSRRLGHASEAITSRIYVHPGDTDAAAHVDGFAGRILGKQSG
jgi:integrase